MKFIFFMLFLFLPNYSNAQILQQVVGTTPAPSGGGTGITFNAPSQSIGTAIGGSTTPSAAFASNPTTGDLVVVHAILLDSSNTTLTSLTDGASNSYTCQATLTFTYVATSGWACYLLSAPSNANKTLTFTFPNSVTAGFLLVSAVDLSYSGGSITFDQDVEASSIVAGSLVNTPSITPSVSGEFLYALAEITFSFGTFTAGTPWTINQGGMGNSQRGTDEYDLSSTSSPTAVSWTVPGGNNATWAAMVSAFK
jgi:hypothetical protein